MVFTRPKRPASKRLKTLLSLLPAFSLPILNRSTGRGRRRGWRHGSRCTIGRREAANTAACRVGSAISVSSGGRSASSPSSPPPPPPAPPSRPPCGPLGAPAAVPHRLRGGLLRGRGGGHRRRVLAGAVRRRRRRRRRRKRRREESRPALSPCSVSVFKLSSLFRFLFFDSGRVRHGQAAGRLAVRRDGCALPGPAGGGRGGGEGSGGEGGGRSEGGGGRSDNGRSSNSNRSNNNSNNTSTPTPTPGPRSQPPGPSPSQPGCGLHPDPGGLLRAAPRAGDSEGAGGSHGGEGCRRRRDSPPLFFSLSFSFSLATTEARSARPGRRLPPRCGLQRAGRLALRLLRLPAARDLFRFLLDFDGEAAGEGQDAL